LEEDFLQIKKEYIREDIRSYIDFLLTFMRFGSSSWSFKTFIKIHDTYRENIDLFENEPLNLFCGAVDKESFLKVLVRNLN